MSNSHASLGKRFLSVLLVLVMVIGMLPTIAFAAGSATYEKTTTLTDGKNYLIVAESGSKYYALNLNSDSTLSAVEVTVATDGKITDDAATAWTASKSGTDWQFKSGDNYLGVSRSKSTGSYVYTLVANTSTSGDDLKNAWTMETSSDYNRLKTTFGTADSPAYRSLAFFDGSWSVDLGYDDKSKISFYEEAEQATVKVGTKISGADLWVDETTAGATTPTATATAGTQTGNNVWDVANTQFGSTRNILGIWDIALTYGTFEMMTVLQDADVTIDLTNITGVQEGDKVHVAHWNGTSFDGLVEKSVETGSSVTIATRDNNPFIVIGDHTLVGTDATGKKVWHNGANPTLTVTSDDVDTSNLQVGTDTQKAWTAANDNSTQPWNKAALTVLDIFDVVVTYGSTVMKELETPVLVTLNVPGVHKNDTVMVAHWNGASFDTPIQAKAPSDDTVTFKADKFSPFVVIGGASYNTITIINTTPGCTITGEGMVMNSTDYTFTVTVDTGYAADDLKVTANGNVFTVGGTKYVKNTDGTYTIKAVDDNYTISAIISKTPVVTHTVTFKANGSGVYDLPEAYTVAAGNKLGAAPADPGRDGYTFMSWNTAADGSGTAYSAETVPADDVVFYAQWQKVIPQYVVTYPASAPGGLTLSKTGAQPAVNEGSTENFTVTLGAGYDPETLVVTANGVELAPVAVDGSKYTYSFIVNAATTVAVLAPSKLTYTVVMPEGDTFTAEFTDHTTSKVLKYGDTYSFTVTPADGYTINEVYVNGVAQGTAGSYGPFTVEGEQSILVKMNKVVFYTVTYVVDGAQLTTRQVQSGTAVNTLGSVSIPEKEGYTASVWYSNGALTTPVNSDTGKVAGDMELYAKYVPLTYTITYDANGGSGAPADQTKKHGEALNLSTTVPAKAGHTFLGWGIGADPTTAVYQPGDQYSNNETVTLVAVWQKNTYTVSLPSGTGYTVSSAMSNIVEYDGSYTFTVKVDRAYATTAPVVAWTKADGTGGETLTNPTADVKSDGSKSYTYTLSGIKEDRVVSIAVVQNKTYTVSFYTITNDTGATPALYLTQEVEDTYLVDQPADPVMEGYTFKGWYKTSDSFADANKFDFTKPITTATQVYGYMEKNTYNVTLAAEGAGWTDDFVDPSVVASTAAQSITVDHGTSVKFQVKVLEGYDASKMQVGVNGKLWAADSIAADGNDTVYTYIIPAVTETTTITVVGVVRKTVTITYNANAGDDVSEMPEQQIVNYYLSGASGNSKIINQIPVRTGYTFLGWCTKSDYDGTSALATGEKFYAKGDIENQGDDAVSIFTKDTTLYAIWQAKSVTIELAVSDVAVPADTGTNAKEYEGQPVTLTATLSPAVSTGSVNFYQSSDGTNWTVISSQSANGSTKYTFEATTGAYSGTDTYKVEYKAESAEGYSDSTSGTVSVDRLSTAITWKLNGDAVDGTVAYGYASTLTITPDGGSALTAGTPMTAGKTYTLTAPAVYELGTDYGTVTPLKVGTDYTITWQYLDGANGWKTLAENQTTSTFQVTSQYSKYQFRALMVVNTGDSTVYTKAAKFANEHYGLRQTETMSWLISEPTPAVVRQATTTTLAITGAVEEAANQVLFGATKFGWGNHLVQYENQTVTLKATVTDNATSLGVNSVGKVYFYRYTNDSVDNNDVLLNANGQGIEVGPDGIATMNYTMPDYDSTKAASDEENCSRIYAVYVEGVTYDTSASVSFTTDTHGVKTYAKPNNGLKNMVFSMSTAIKTPVIDSANAGTGGATSTTYAADLTGLKAGVSHTFTLRTGNAAADWSVVALDGRTVAAENYDIQWLVTTGSNEEQAANEATQASFVVNESKNGDKYRVKLTAKGDMTVDAYSKYAVINSLQDVTVKVTAIDVITSTEVDRANNKYPDVYQLNNITLTAEVLGKDSQIMKPTGNVTFYYSVNGTNWVEIGTAALELDNVSGTKKATIVTDKLPVDVVNGYKQEEVTITAVYAGDETFKASNNSTTKDDGNDSITAGDYVQPDKVTVYSSVVLVHAAEENTAVTSLSLTNGGIHITANGSLVANETDVALTLQQVYTLDHDHDLSKLVYGTDYTVEWQILENASQYNDNGYYGDTEKWNDIGATGSSYTIGTVRQNAAYRAKITVVDMDTAPAVQGSVQGVKQGAANATTTGRKVYYSNVLVVGAGQATVTTNITTSANTNFNEEGIVEGETVTIHALVAGASNVTPISNLTATITAKNVAGLTPGYEVFSDEVTTVNGYNAFTWNTTGVTPGYYTLTVKATSNNGYAPQTITRTLIVRDKTYTLTATNESKVYNGKAQGIDWTLTGIDIEDVLAQKSVVVYYKQNGKLVEPTQAGTYDYELILPASAYWTELTHVTGEFTITPRPVNVVDLVAQAKVYDGTTNANIQEIILEDAATDQGTTGLPTGSTGVINGDSVYAVGTGYTAAATAGATTTLGVKDVTLKGDDAANYELVGTYAGEDFVIQRSQVKGDIANSTYKYTGSNITVPADDIYLIDQAGNQLSNYTVTYYYHNGDGVEKVDAMNKLGKYTVIARPEQDNYKGGASQTVYVAATADDQDPDTTAKSALIDITNTVELYGAAGNRGIVATATNGATTTVGYWNGTTWADRPTAAGRYLVKATVTNGTVTDTAYGIYTIVKARPEFVPTTNSAEPIYNSAPYSGTVDAGFVADKSDSTAKTYITYTGGTIQGIAYEAPTEVGKYIATVHVGETDNYTAHEEQVAFEIKPAPLTITADDLARWQYGSYPDMVATFEGLATEGVAPDTSLRDVQIQPEFIFNDLNGDGQPEYTNSALDQVGKNYPITVRNALARNYTVTYVAGSYAVNELDPKADLAIHGMIDNGITNPAPVNIAYYGDEIQLYAYGNYKSNGDGTGVYNPSSLLNWKVSDPSIATIDAEKGLLTITGVGDFTVTLTRGSGDAAISTTLTITAKPKEVVVNVPDVDKVYKADVWTYDGTVTIEGLIGTDTVTPDVVTGTNKRTDVGSQITQYKVNSSTTVPYVSETYGGLFTINDKEVTVKPSAATTTYGTKASGLTYTEVTPAGSDTVLTNGKAVSVADAYANLDVSTYEILVAGVENKNYNVKYLTNPDADKVTVNPLNLTVSTGTLDANVGMTSGSLNPLGNYPANGAVVDPAAALGASNVRMYGEPNWVMDYDVWTDPDKLITGDSLADLATLPAWLVKFDYTKLHNIAEDANLQYPVPQSLMTGKSNYSIDSSMSFGNYNESYNKGTQNIYQRPVTLKLRGTLTELSAYQPTILNSDNTVKTDELLKLILNNLVVEKYNNGGTLEGGLATLLKHTIADLQITFATTPTYDQANKTITAKIKLGNQNYWIDGGEYTVTVKVDPTKVYAEYGPLGWTSATVTMKQLNEDNTITYANLGSSKVWYYIYKKDATLAEAYQKYSSYKDREYERKVQMTYSGSNGLYIANYDRLSAGDYVMFAIVEGYTIIE